MGRRGIVLPQSADAEDRDRDDVAPYYEELATRHSDKRTSSGLPIGPPSSRS
jgi:hypothetical protein